jgi:hypothetical protein
MRGRTLYIEALVSTALSLPLISFSGKFYFNVGPFVLYGYMCKQSQIAVIRWSINDLDKAIKQDGGEQNRIVQVD